MPQTKYNLHLKGFVGGSDFDRDYVDYVLGRNAKQPVTVLIDSTGGNLATALSISSAFKMHGDVTVHFVGMNASAATIASLGARHISIDTNAMYLVHKCSTDFFEWGQLNADQMADLITSLEKQRSDLDKLDCNVAAMYAAKCKKRPQALLDLMKTGGWLTAAEAKEWGFVDEITDAPEDAAPRLTDAVASAMAAEGMPIPNIPVADRDSALSKFFAAIASLFKSNNQSTDHSTLHTPHSTKMSTLTAPHICSLLSLPTLELAEDSASATLSVEQIARLEAAIAEAHVNAEKYEAEISALTSRIAELEKRPAADTTAIVNDKPGAALPKEETPFEAMCRVDREARALYDALG